MASRNKPATAAGSTGFAPQQAMPHSHQMGQSGPADNREPPLQGGVSGRCRSRPAGSSRPAIDRGPIRSVRVCGRGVRRARSPQSAVPRGRRTQSPRPTLCGRPVFADRRFVVIAATLTGSSRRGLSGPPGPTNRSTGPSCPSRNGRWRLCGTARPLAARAAMQSCGARAVGSPRTAGRTPSRTVPAAMLRGAGRRLQPRHAISGRMACHPLWPCEHSGSQDRLGSSTSTRRRQSSHAAS
jgi:hypothetical protein